MVLAIGSMAVKAVFNGSGLLSGLAKTGDKLKEVSQRSKSTTTEMKRMQGGAHKLRNALAAIGVGGFTALLLSAPQLAGSLAKIKYEMQQLAWSVGKHLKPALDSVATILQGIRTGDWETVMQGVNDLKNSLIDLAGIAVDIILEPQIGKEATEEVKTDFNNWVDEFKTNLKEKNLWAALWEGSVSAFTWGIEHLGGLYDWLDKIGIKLHNLSKVVTNFLTPEWVKSIGSELLKLETLVGKTFYEPLGLNFGTGSEKSPEWGGASGHTNSTGFGGSYQVGGYVPKTGLYNLHAGETVTMKGSSGSSNNGSANITVDFSNANINLASGIEIDQFADMISRKIADRQNTLTY